MHKEGQRSYEKMCLHTLIGLVVNGTHLNDILMRRLDLV